MAKDKAKTRSRTSRGKAESVTGAKENQAEIRGGELGLPEPVQIASDDFKLHFKAIKSAIERRDTQANLVRACIKAANKIHPELGKAIQSAITLERKGDPAKLKARLEVFGIALKEIGCPIQLSVFDTLKGDVLDQAYKRGVTDGKAGKTADNRYPEGSDLAAAYTDGWQHGTGENLGLTKKETDAAIGKKNGSSNGHARETAQPELADA